MNKDTETKLIVFVVIVAVFVLIAARAFAWTACMETVGDSWMCMIG